MGLVNILGSLLPSQNFQASFGVNSIQEELLIEMSSPLERQTDVVNALPVYGQAGPWTFTIGISTHPYRTDLILKSCDGVREAPEGRPFWVVSVTYETGQWLNQESYPNEDRGRGNIERKKKLDESNPSSPVPIDSPYDEPPTWSSTTRTVRITRYQDEQGNLLQHANGLPLTDGIDAELVLEAHTFTWNIPYVGFTYSSKVRPYVYKINEATTFGFPPGFVFLESVSCTENYREVNIPGTNGQPAQHSVFHFITMNATFLIDVRGNALPAGSKSYFQEQYRRVSMHTMERLLFPGVPTPIASYVPIAINDRGDKAEAPWPLLSQTKAAALGLDFGRAVPYEQMNSVNPTTDFHFVETGLPQSAALHTFRANNKLDIP